jgi:predicted XRE-type DNA-binding protein
MSNKKNIKKAIEKFKKGKGSTTDFSMSGLSPEMKLKKQFAMKIRNYRYDKGLTNQQLAKIIKSSESQASKICTLKVESMEIGRLLAFVAAIPSNKNPYVEVGESLEEIELS